MEGHERTYEVSVHVIVVLVDTSWNTQNKTGMGLLVYDDVGILGKVEYRSLQAEGACQAEATTLQLAIVHDTPGGATISPTKSDPVH